jgi:hypothetical protein
MQVHEGRKLTAFYSIFLLVAQKWHRVALAWAFSSHAVNSLAAIAALGSGTDKEVNLPSTVVVQYHFKIFQVRTWNIEGV